MQFWHLDLLHLWCWSCNIDKKFNYWKRRRVQAPTVSRSKVNQYLESKDPRRKRDNQRNLIDCLEKRIFFSIQVWSSFRNFYFWNSSAKNNLNWKFSFEMSCSFLICTWSKLNHLTKELKKSWEKFDLMKSHFWKEEKK